MGFFDFFKKIFPEKTAPQPKPRRDDEPIDWTSMYAVVNNLGIRGYIRKHNEECQYIWSNLVPEDGQADSVQGELLREAVKLRVEACNNGNVNWDDNFAWFCGNIGDILTGSGVFGDDECIRIRKVLGFIWENGEYARSYRDGEIPDDDCDPLKLAYTDDDLYYYLYDVVAEYYLANREPIPYEKKDFIRR